MYLSSITGPLCDLVENDFHSIATLQICANGGREIKYLGKHISL